jgi:predicted Zn-dependent protease
VKQNRPAAAPPVDINALFARAERAFVAGQADAARRDLLEVRRLAGDHPTVLHLLALIEKKRGDLAAAKAAFARAAALAPKDPQVAGNYANLLSDLGEIDAALRLYGEALNANPAFHDARLNRALLLERLGRLDEALVDLQRLAAAKPADARVQTALGGVLRRLGRLDEAAAAYDVALRADPNRLPALHGRGRTGLERGEIGASAFYRRALAQQPDNPELVLGLAEALEAEGDPAGLSVLHDAVARHSDWIGAHEVLARMRSEAGEGDRFADHFETAIAQRPADLDLNIAYWRSLARGQQHGRALAALRAARPHLPDDGALTLMEGVFLSESGQPEEALRLLDRLGEAGPDVRFARARIALRAGDPAPAADLLERFVDERPDSINGWANLDLAWRLVEDDRHEWLTGQPGLYGPRDIGLSAAELAATAELLRTLHVTRSHPIGQSLRGGTQTRGRLFNRREPEIVRLHGAIRTAIHDHVADWPARDDTHPLLRHRDARFAIEGSWSVRLTGQGFHVSHIHPEGVLSSACYISLPESLGDQESRAGWLELGRPPTELGLPLEPLAVIEPRPGRLALFPSYLFHGTRPFERGERLTVAFDVVTR